MNTTTAARTNRKSRNLTVDLVDLLERRIREGMYPLGARMPTEAEIMDEHGVSRTVVREAISRLQQAALVVTHHGVGSFVAEALPDSGGFRIGPAELATIVDIINVLELRISIETECAGLAALRRNERHVAEMKSALEEFDSRAQAGEQTVEADFRFHMTIAEATRNPYFLDLIRHLGTAVIPRARANSPKIAKDEQRAYLERVNREHRGILDAIERQDAESARAAMRVHLTNSRERYRKAAEAGERIAAATGES